MPTVKADLSLYQGYTNCVRGPGDVRRGLARRPARLRLPETGGARRRGRRTAFYAVGDVAPVRPPTPGRAVRSEPWTSAVDQATAVAHGIVQSRDPRLPERVDFVWSDQCGTRIRGWPMATRNCGSSGDAVE